MDILYWIIIVTLFITSFIGLVYPIIPSAIFLVAGFITYGCLFSFEDLPLLFWFIQGFFVIFLFVADYLSNLIGVKKFGGSKAAIWGSTIGIIVGPFVLPFFGIILGPFIGAILAEMIIHKKQSLEAVKIGAGSVIGFFSGVVAKGIIQVAMIVYFLVIVL